MLEIRPFTLAVAMSLMLVPATASADWHKMSLELDPDSSLEDVVISIHYGSEASGMTYVAIPDGNIELMSTADGYVKMSAFFQMDGLESPSDANDWRFSVRVDGRDAEDSLIVAAFKVKNGTTGVEHKALYAGNDAQGRVAWTVAETDAAIQLYETKLSTSGGGGKLKTTTTTTLDEM